MSDLQGLLGLLFRFVITFESAQLLLREALEGEVELFLGFSGFIKLSLHIHCFLRQIVSIFPDRLEHLFDVFLVSWFVVTLVNQK